MLRHDLVENDLLLLFGRRLQFLLNEARAVLIAAELDYVAEDILKPQLSERRIRITYSLLYLELPFPDFVITELLQQLAPKSRVRVLLPPPTSVVLSMYRRAHPAMHVQEIRIYQSLRRELLWLRWIVLSYAVSYSAHSVYQTIHTCMPRFFVCPVIGE